MTRISKRTREQAALICAIAASTPRGYAVADGMRWLRDRYFKLHSRALQSDHVYLLVDSAFKRAYQNECTKLAGGFQDWPVQMAEAEALLRTGWSP